MYKTDFYKMKENAGRWLFYQNLEFLRKELWEAYGNQLEKNASLPVYQVYRVIETRGAPIANNAKKCFETPIHTEKFLIFEGNDILLLNRIVNNDKMRYLGMENVKHICVPNFVFER